MAPTSTNPGADRPPESLPDPAPTVSAAAGATVIVLAEDVALLELLREALEGRQRVWRAENPVQAADLVVATHSGVLFIDAGLLQDQTPALVDRLHEQFPDFPIVVTGRRDDELELGTRISSGAVFRFLHKPVSADRVRNFIDAAARRGERVAGATMPAGGSASDPAKPLDSSLSIALPRMRFNREIAARVLKVTGAGAVVAVAAWALVLTARHRPWEQITQQLLTASAPSARVQTGPTAAKDDARTLERLLGAAGVALSQDRLTEPQGQNAVELYRLVLRADPGNTQAQQGLALTVDKLLRGVERLLLAEDLDAAARALDAARSVDPSNSRLEFFSSQLAYGRERLQRAASGTASGIDPASRAEDERIAGLLKLADERMREGSLVDEPGSVESLVLEARAVRPEDPGVQQALNALSGRMLLASNDAIRDGDPTAAIKWLDRAARLGVDEESVERLRATIESERLATVQEDRSRLLALASQRIAQGHVLTPAGDSARHYVDLLRAADPGFAGLAETEALLAASLLEQAGALTRTGRYADAGASIAAAASAGASGSGLAAARSALVAAQARAGAAREVLPESAMTRIAGPPAVYPARAEERGMEGWVEVRFTVATDGSTRDAVVLASEPAGVFDQAVLDAIALWRYQPRIVAGSPLDQQVRARLRFELDGR